VTRGTCLVTGNEDVPIAKNETVIKGVWGAQTAGANIVSFNDRAFESYGKRERQGENSPISQSASFAYTTALNQLLRKDSSQRLQVGDASTVFWADRPTELETSIVDIFGEPPKDDPDRNVRAVASLYRAIDNGLMEKDEGKTRFFVLGLSPNAARIAIRFWHHATVADMAARIRQHFDDLAIVRSERDPPYPTLFRLLVSVATQGKADNIPPNLGGELMRSILADLPYPQTILAAAVRRVRAEHEVPYPRAALIKACINRDTRYSKPSMKEELKMSLDESNVNVGYRLGRLFAVLEKIQEEANPGINATIRDRFYGAASSTPVTVFSTLLKLKNHHLSKLDNRGRAVNLEKRIGEIIEGIGDFPAQLPLVDQGRFAIGYYHQRQDFFKKHDTSTEGA
jgi:CRISPR-associated protein Csd1